MSSLVGFLLERIKEDERTPIDKYFRRRWLEECAVKRKIVLWAHGARLDVDSVNGVLFPLALPYADHPDYREEWEL